MKARLKKALISAVTVIAVSGCAAVTTKYDAGLAPQYQVSASRATITVRTPYRFVGAAQFIEIQDGETKIGKLGRGGELTWGHEPGYVAIVTVRDTTPAHALIFPVDAGKTYILKAEVFQYPNNLTYCVPENFPPESVAFEDISKADDWGKSHLSSNWRVELKKLQLGLH